MNLSEQNSVPENNGTATSDNNPYPKGSVAADLKTAFQNEKTAYATAPEHWSDEDKATFSSLDDRTKSWVMRRHKSMEADYTKKTTDISKERKRYGDLQKIFDEYKDDLSRAGVDEAAAVAELFGVYRNLKRNPQATIKHISDLYGYNAEAVPPVKNNEPSDIKKEIDQLKGVLAQQQMQQAAGAIRIGQQRIKDMIEAKDVTGKNMYPHFDTLLPHITMLAHADLLQGKQPDLKDLYERAGWAHPNLREEFLSGHLKSAEKRKQDEDRAKVEIAKRAGASIYGTPGANAVQRKPAQSLREELEAAYRNAQA
ncbi:MAG: hypothetical protein EYC62_02535 [Alphaproteobacteria bacterium]|nr:MAG: hypothetical protein EYC62_02535 [Alphaproteobacteria bacterium]